MFHQCFHCFSSCQVCGVSLGARKIGSDTPIERYQRCLEGSS
jgi:hypothetical protein